MKSWAVGATWRCTTPSLLVLEAVAAERIVAADGMAGHIVSDLERVT
jgi:hypothetical protein